MDLLQAQTAILQAALVKLGPSTQRRSRPKQSKEAAKREVKLEPVSPLAVASKCSPSPLLSPSSTNLLHSHPSPSTPTPTTTVSTPTPLLLPVSPLKASPAPASIPPTSLKVPQAHPTPSAPKADVSRVLIRKPPQPRSPHIHTWTKDEVYSFFVDFGCPQIAKTLLAAQLDGQFLYQLRNDQYLMDVGLDDFGSKRLVNAALICLFDNEGVILKG